MESIEIIALLSPPPYPHLPPLSFSINVTIQSIDFATDPLSRFVRFFEKSGLLNGVGVYLPACPPQADPVPVIVLVALGALVLFWLPPFYLNH